MGGTTRCVWCLRFQVHRLLEYLGRDIGSDLECEVKCDGAGGVPSCAASDSGQGGSDEGATPDISEAPSLPQLTATSTVLYIH